MPREACGLLFGTDEEIDAAEVTENVADNLEQHFEIDPRALFSALRAERAGGRKVAGYWHSHPSGDARPSATDMAMAAADGKLWVIVGAHEVTAWHSVENGQFEPVEIALGD